jgi:hypothetical protein
MEKSKTAKPRRINSASFCFVKGRFCREVTEKKSGSVSSYGESFLATAPNGKRPITRFRFSESEVLLTYLFYSDIFVTWLYV